MICFLETGPFSNQKNAESLPNLPPKKGGGVKRGFVSDPLSKKRSPGVQLYFQFYVISNFYKKEAREVFEEKSELARPSGVIRAWPISTRNKEMG